MPESPLFSILAWLARHPVAMTLLAFLVVGLRLDFSPEPPASPLAPPASGPQSMPLSAQERISVGRADPDGHGAVEWPQGPAPHGKAPGPAGLRPGPATAEPPQAVAAPRLIGGTLPLYENPRGRPGAGQTADGFRPPSVGWQPPPAPATLEARLQSARRAFWSGDFAAAEAAYLEAIATYPDEPDNHGELGNFYLSTGQPAAAMDAFHAAGVRVQARGETEKLNIIISILSEHGDSRGVSLRP